VYYGVGLPSWHRLLPLSQIHTLKQPTRQAAAGEGAGGAGAIWIWHM